MHLFKNSMLIFGSAGVDVARLWRTSLMFRNAKPLVKICKVACAYRRCTLVKWGGGLQNENPDGKRKASLVVSPDLVVWAQAMGWARHRCIYIGENYCALFMISRSPTTTPIKAETRFQIHGLTHGRGPALGWGIGREVKRISLP